ncbi:glycosyl hydrolase 2 galactose-binding domain-containing protein [Lentzea sp. NPDC004789]
MTSIVKRLALVVLLVLASCVPATVTRSVHPPFGTPTGTGEVTTFPDWQLRSSSDVPVGGDVVSRPEYDDRGWTTVPRRSTVMGGLLAAGQYPDIHYSTNMRDKVDAARFAVPWWYRRTFLAEARADSHTFLRLPGGIIPSAEIWLNGTKIAGPDVVAGAYPAHDFEVQLRPGKNALAIKVFPAVSDKYLSIEFLDWTQPPPDMSMGVWRDVQLVRTGPVSLHNARVITSLDVPSLETADLTIKAELTNHTSSDVEVLVRGSADGPFEETVKVPAMGTTTVETKQHMERPRVWWPYAMGDQPLYRLDLDAVVGGRSSDRAATDFGIKHVRSSLNSDGALAFEINGRPFHVRGAGWVPDLFLRDDRQRMRDQLSYVRDLGLNTLRLEGKGEQNEFYELADRLGIVLMPGWECCTRWQHNDTWTQEEFAVARASAVTEGFRLQNHPSVLSFYVGSDEAPRPEVERTYLEAFASTDWSLPLLPAIAPKASERLGPSGNKGAGPYWFVPPNYFYGDVGGGAFGFEGENGPGPAIPELAALKSFLSDAELEALWRDADSVQYHLSVSETFSRLGDFWHALANRYGKPSSLEDFVRKAQLMNYEVNRAQFEAHGRNALRPTNPSTGDIYWMLDNAQPELYWHLFDYSMTPSGGYFGAREGMRPQHVQYSYDDNTVWALGAVEGMNVQTTVFELDGTVHSDSSVTASGPGAVDKVELGTSRTYLVRLLLRDASGKVVDRNVYWLSTSPDVTKIPTPENWDHLPQTAFADFTGLMSLPHEKLSVSSTVSGTRADVTLTNNGDSVALFTRVSIHKGAGGPEIAPALWTDNYVTLWPGETVTVSATYREELLGGATPTVEVS